MGPIAVLCHPEENVWIIEVLAKRIAAGLQKIGQQAEYVTSLGQDYPIIYYMNYIRCLEVIKGSRQFTYITHIDDPAKLSLLRQQAEAGIVGICMSEDTARRLRELTGTRNFIGLTPPALRYGSFKPLKMLFASRLYDDGRKNVSIFERSLSLLSEADIELFIIGSGWESFIEKVKPILKKVHYSPQFSEETYLQYIAETDLLVYGGFDEGAISVIDYLAAGKKVLATAQGYHLDFCTSENAYLFSNDTTLIEQTRRILDKRRQEQQIYARLTDWDSYCHQHVEIFNRPQI